MDGRTNKRTNKSPPVIYRTLSPSGPLPKKEKKGKGHKLRMGIVKILSKSMIDKDRGKKNRTELVQKKKHPRVKKAGKDSDMEKKEKKKEEWLKRLNALRKTKLPEKLKEKKQKQNKGIRKNAMAKVSEINFGDFISLVVFFF